MEQLLNRYFPVLDNGFVAVVDYMGNDNAICEAARCSYGKGTKKVSNNEGLIRTLIRDNHTSPLEMCEIKLHIGLPIFVARQWIRHRTASVNETSGRYSVLNTDFYTPHYNRHVEQDKLNKQGGSDNLLGEVQYGDITINREKNRKETKKLYEKCLEYNLAREISRIDLPLSTYTYWYWKIDLHNLLHFIKLRLDKHAQWEIRQYAKLIAGIVSMWVPHTWKAFNDYVLNGVYFSMEEQKILSNIISNTYVTKQDFNYTLYKLLSNSSLSKREQVEFEKKIAVLFDKEDAKYDKPELNLDNAKDASYFDTQHSG